MFDARKRILEELSAMIDENQALQRHMRNDDNRIPDQREDWMNVIELDDVVEALDMHTRRRMMALLAALDRVNNGTYGFSGSSGRPIEEARLRAIPEATLTADEARAAEEAGDVPPLIHPEASRRQAEEMEPGKGPVGRSPGPTRSLDTRQTIPEPERAEDPDAPSGRPAEQVRDEEGTSPPGEYLSDDRAP